MYLPDVRLEHSEILVTLRLHLARVVFPRFLEELRLLVLRWLMAEVNEARSQDPQSPIRLRHCLYSSPLSTAMTPHRLQTAMMTLKAEQGR